MTFNSTSKEFALQKDKDDVLKSFRDQFYIDSENTIYLDGNSLGRLPKKTKTLIADVVQNQWGKDLIESWNRQWYRKSLQLGDKIAPIIGASPGEVVVSDSTSMNLYKLAHAALRYQKNRKEIVSDVLNFPTDLYILQGLIREFGPDYKLILANSLDGETIDLEEIKSKITPETALVVLSLVAFKSAFMYPLETITKHAHEMGALVLWDLSHASGAVQVDLNKAEADLAVGCTYKYLNGGPGSPAFLYVRNDLQDQLFTPVQGWFGDAAPFEFDLSYRPASGIRKFLSGTPPVVSLMAIEPGIDIINEAGMVNIQTKSRELSEYFLHLVKEQLLRLDFKTGSPLNVSQRGSHFSLKHPEAYRICQALIHPQNSNVRIIPDFREPDNIRFGFTPLYTSFTEIWKTVQRLHEIVTTREFEKYQKVKKEVT